MNPVLVVLAVATVVGGVVAVATRDARGAVVGLGLVAVIAPLVAPWPPAPLPLAARVVAGVLAGWLLSMAVRSRPPTEGSALGWPAEALLAAAGMTAGAAVAGRGVAGAPEALVAASGLAVLAVAPLLRARDALRVVVGLLLAVHAVALARAGLVADAAAVDAVAVGGLVIAVAASGAVLAAVTLRGGGTLALVGARAPGAHRPAAGTPAPAVAALPLEVERARAERSAAAAERASARLAPGASSRIHAVRAGDEAPSDPPGDAGSARGDAGSARGDAGSARGDAGSARGR